MLVDPRQVDERSPADGVELGARSVARRSGQVDSSQPVPRITVARMRARVRGDPVEQRRLSGGRGVQVEAVEGEPGRVACTCRVANAGR